jgi:hypothetical protein
MSFSRNRLREVATRGIGIDVVRQVNELPLLLGVLISRFFSLKRLALFAQAVGQVLDAAPLRNAVAPSIAGPHSWRKDD